MTERPSDQEAATPTQQRAIELTRSLEMARAETMRLAEENARLSRRVAELEAVSASVRESRRAAVNVMEDAVRSNRIAEALNTELKHEIAERQRAEAALRASEERLRTLSDALPQLIWTNDATGSANSFNRRWHEYSGLSFEQSAGLGWQAIVQPDDAAEAQRKWREAFAAGRAFDREFRLRRADGEYRWFIGRNVPLRDAGGQITGWVGSATDIQELKEAQATVHSREEQFRRAIEEAPVPVIMHAEDGQVLQISQAWTELTGYTREEMPSFDAWLNGAYGYGADAVRERMRAVFATGEATGQIEFEIVTRRGERRHWLFSASMPGTLLDGRRYAVGMAIDLTERKRAEAALGVSQERLRLVVESALEHAIISMNLDRQVTSWNTGAERMLGYSRDEIVGQPADAIFTPEDRAAGAPEREATLALERGRAGDERWHLRKDGSRFWGSGVMLPMYERPGGAPTGVIKILRDETDRRLAQEALEKSRQELLVALGETDRARAEAEAAMRSRDDFLAALSHELRTPLNPVLLLASEAAENGALAAAVRENFATIRNNVQLEARLIDDLLDLTHIARGKLPLDCRPVDSHAVLREAAAIVGPEIAAKNIEFTMKLTAAKTTLYADPVRLQQVFWNVLKNAVKFTPDGGRVEVVTRNGPASDRLVIAVGDTGIGMTPQEIERVFTAFAQGDHADHRGSHRFGGLGLGLTISRMLAELHGGTIRATSGGRNSGSVFEVDLPVAVISAEPVASLKTATGAPLSATQMKRLQDERILLVEDHEPTRLALASLLRRRGLVVETAGAMAEAREKAACGNFSLLLSDIGLPDGSGYELMRELKNRYGLRGVALTGYGTEADVARSSEAGFLTHVTKPVSAQALDRALALVDTEKT